MCWRENVIEIFHYCVADGNAFSRTELPLLKKIHDVNGLLWTL